jgi:hypothetical protein
MRQMGELFEDYQYARNGVALEEDRKRGFLMKHVYTDPRIPWNTTMNYCNLNNLSYDATIEKLQYACMTSPEDMQVIRMNKVTTKPQQSSHTTNSLVRENILSGLINKQHSHQVSSIVAIIRSITAGETIVGIFTKLILTSSIPSSLSQ